MKRMVISKVGYSAFEKLLNLPEGVKLKAVLHVSAESLGHEYFEVLLESDEFQEVPEGNMIPMVDLIQEWKPCFEKTIIKKYD